MANQADIADVIKSIQADVTTIVKGELELAKAELVPQVKSVGIGAGLFGAAGYLAVNAASLSFLALSALIGYWFATGLGWATLAAAAAGLGAMTLLLLLLAGVLAMVGKGKVTVPGPKQTVAQGQLSVEAVQDAVQSGVQSAEAEATARQEARKAAPGITTGHPDFVPPTR